MIKKIKKALGVKDAGFFEYLFSFLAIVSVLPSVICYFLILMLILRPVNALVRSVWK
tara:strand:+ start:820 stop:990 length:171 start_codon:yes stop_codon:yes gene_type:complete